MHQDAKEILYTAEQLQARVAELGKAISEDYKNESVVLVGVLKGAIVFFTDLARAIDDSVDVSFDFISCSSYGSGTTSTGVRLAALLNKPDRRKMDVDVDYVGFIIPDYFVIGYGLDYAEKYRHLPYIGILKEEMYQN